MVQFYPFIRSSLRDEYSTLLFLLFDFEQVVS